MVCIYFIANLLVFISALIARNLNERNKRILFFMCCAFWAVVFGFKGYEVGNDTYNYVLYYTNRGVGGEGYGTIQFPGDSIEWGFIIVTRILHFISQSPTFLFSVLAIAIFSSIYVLYKKSADPFISLLYLFSMTTSNLVLMTALRQQISIACILIAFMLFATIDDDLFKWKNRGKLFRKSKFLMAIALFLFSLTVHRTSLILLPLFVLIYLIKNTKKLSYVILTFSFIFLTTSSENSFKQVMNLVLGFVSSFTNDNISLLADRYSDSAGETSMSAIRAIAFFGPAFITTYLMPKSSVNSFFFKCYILGLLILSLFGTSYMSTRISLAFFVVGFAGALPPAVKTNKKYFYLYMLFGVYYLWRAYVGYGKWPITDSALPYTFFWE